MWARRILKGVRHPVLAVKYGISQYHSFRNYRAFLSTGERAVDGDLPYDAAEVRRRLEEEGIEVRSYSIPLEKFRDYLARVRYPKFYTTCYGSNFVEKALEHYASFQFRKLDPACRVIDVANQGSPYPRILHELFGCEVFSNDLVFPAGERKIIDWHTQIGGSACRLPVCDNFFDLIVLHCALEMFEGRDDIDLVTEAARVLKPGGQLVIVPLYLGEIYHVFRDPRTNRKQLPDIDRGARLVYRNNFFGVAFARFYDVVALRDRLATASPDLKLTVYEATNAKEADPGCYLRWIGVFEKAARKS